MVQPHEKGSISEEGGRDRNGDGATETRSSFAVDYLPNLFTVLSLRNLRFYRGQEDDLISSSPSNPRLPF